MNKKVIELILKILLIFLLGNLYIFSDLLRIRSLSNSILRHCLIKDGELNTNTIIIHPPRGLY